MDQSRSEGILKSILSGDAYEKIPQSRIEELLLELGELIQNGGATPEQIKEAVFSYLDAHPVQAGQISKTELDNILKNVYGG